MKKFLVFSVLLLLSVLLFAVILQQEGEIEYNATGAKIQAALAYYGINSAVDVSDRGVVVAFELPEDMDAKASVEVVVDVVKELSNPREIVVRVCKNYTPVETIILIRGRDF